jgi:hypothetical protein
MLVFEVPDLPFCEAITIFLFKGCPDLFLCVSGNVRLQELHILWMSEPADTI